MILKKKLLASGAAVALSMGVLAGCGGEEEPGTDMDMEENENMEDDEMEEED